MTHRTLLTWLFFFSGVAALAYEVVWIRLLSLTLSITVYSLTTVLCAFMAGLALGAAIAARIADRTRYPLVVFAVAEFGIGICGVAIPYVLANMGPAYLWLHDLYGGSGLGFTIGRFALCFSVLLIPTTLMGVTLPFLSRAVIDRNDVVGRGAGGLYAANTFGAVVGCVAAGFILIPVLGLLATSACAAALNLAVAGVALARGRRVEVVPAIPGAPGAAGQRMPAIALLACLAFAVSGFTAMGYEVLWTRALEHFTHNSTYAYSAMLATFLLGLAVGSSVTARVADRLSNPLLVLAGVQLGVGLAVSAALLIYIQFDWLIPSIVDGIGGIASWPRVVLLMFTEAGLTMLVSTLLLGATFPLVVRIAVDSLSAVGRRVGIAYVANTVGSILGSLLVGFVVLPALGVRGSFLALIVMNLALGAVLALRAAPGRAGFAGFVVATLAAWGAFVQIPPHLFEEQFSARFGELIFYREEVTDTVMVTEAEDGSRMIRFSDGRGTAGTATYIGDRMYAHIPLLLHPAPREILQIAFGVGNSLSSALTHQVRKVTCVELSPGVIDAAPHFQETNRDALDDPRVTLVIHDGRNFLLTSRERFDVIRLDPPELHTAGVVNLYTREFYQLAREHLAEGGIFSIWINSWMTPEEGIRMLLRTVADVFPHVSVWHDPQKYSWIINGSMTPHAPDLAVLESHFAEPQVRADMKSINVPDAWAFLRHFVFTGEELIEYAGEGPLVVDDHTRLDFIVPRSRESYFGIANQNTERWLVDRIYARAGRDSVSANFLHKVARLLRYKTSVVPHLVNLETTGLTPEEVERRVDAASVWQPQP